MTRDDSRTNKNNEVGQKSTSFSMLSEDCNTSESPAAALVGHVALNRHRLAVGALDFVHATRGIGMKGLDFPAALAKGIDSLNSAGLKRIERDHLIRVPEALGIKHLKHRSGMRMQRARKTTTGRMNKQHSTNKHGLQLTSGGQPRFWF